MLLVLFKLLTWAVLSWTAQAMRQDHLGRLRRETVDMFYHGFDNYMEHAFPEDELRPLTCQPLTRDRENPAHIGLNDALGNYSLTLIDSLSTLAILASGPEDGSGTGSNALNDFQDGVADFVRYYGDGRPGISGQGKRAMGFDLDSKVQVFETVIRGLGGLLSAHLFAIGELPIAGYTVQPAWRVEADDPLELAPIAWPNGFKYDGQLLRLAFDLGQRLLPAFYTDTGIPYPRVNLRHGIPFYTRSPLFRQMGGDKPEDSSAEITETCSAGAGSLTLEFTVLSRLSGDDRFEQAAKRAFWAVWGRRSEIGLVGNGLDAEGGQWIGPHAGIGAGMDSFFEYALKSHILLSGHSTPNKTSTSRQTSTKWLDPNTIHPPLPTELQTSEAFLDAWHQAHASVKRYLYTDRSHYPYYSNIHRTTGQPYTMWIDSLGAFYPGLLAMAGEVDEAIEANLVYTALWTRYSALPERWSVRENNVDQGLGWWPGRPEFIESTYYIYRATQDPWYLHVGEMVLRDIERRCRTSCGWAGIQDVRTGELSDRMESFFLGETTKYMYLLFDPDHPLNKVDAAFVFSTEGHPLIIPKRIRPKPTLRRSLTKRQAASNNTEDQSFTRTCPVPTVAGLAGSATAARPDLFSVALFVDLHNTPDVHGPLEAVEVFDKKKGLVTKYRATTNYTMFPWTLPPTMLPQDGVCTAPAERVLAWIEFPPGDTASSLVSRFGTSLVWYSHNGPTVRNLDNMRLQLERQGSRAADGFWRITHAAGRELGRHENVFFHAEHVRNYKDEAFTCLRRKDMVEIDLLLDAPEKLNTSAPAPAPGVNASGEILNSHAALPSESLFKSLLRAVSSVFEPAYTDLPESEGNGPGPTTLRWSAYTATGPGAFPMPPIVDTPMAGSPSYNSRRPAANFPWRTVFLGGQACDAPLPEASSRQHQIIVLRRGGCSFSEKLERIPNFSSSPHALQLVIVIDEDEDEEGVEDLVRPLLTVAQKTPRGMERLNGVPLVLMRGGKGDYARFGEAKGVGMRRKYLAESQGMLIENAIVL
ncbi:glycosyl hydrolase family 47-domain-containing protein [Fusarium flagelliforme]|nr:glycosyl hydrolase family 47-domain-containing protein [Fusarium flagelliforme]KAH7196697.1 glycosyl hydrolase family 47-domain-containing protein [Fusarium flagelliforme]